MAQSTGGKTLVVFDFDWTLVDSNADAWVIILGGDKAHSLQSQFGTGGFRHSCWTGTYILSPRVLFSVLHFAKSDFQARRSTTQHAEKRGGVTLLDRE